ncbi:piggyBac transposable element-derived protein 4, partial [Trichonephila clavipes]
MPRKFLTQIEIENLMKDLEEENFDDSDSENEDEFENNEVDFDQKVESLIAWKEVEGSEVIQYEILEVLVAETNRYAITVLNLHEETSDKRKHASSWKPADKNEILGFLGLILLMGHIEKDCIQDYWTTNN